MSGIIITTLGVLLTIVFGIYSIWTYKKTKKKVSLEFKKKECYSLFKDDVTRLNIELIYNKKPVSNSLLLLKAKLINNGQVDIDNNRIHKPLKIISRKEFKWLEIRITNQPESVSTNIEIINNNEVLFEWDLLKVNEFIEIEALVEIENNIDISGNKVNEFYNEIKFDYRITDLNSIQKDKPVIKEDKSRNLVKMALVLLIVGAFLILIYFFPIIDIFPKRYSTEFLLNNGKIEEVGSFETKDKNNIEIKLIKSNEKFVLSNDEFNKRYKIVQIANNRINEDQGWILGIIYCILGIIFLLLRFFIKNKKKVISNKIK